MPRATRRLQQIKHAMNDAGVHCRLFSPPVNTSLCLFRAKVYLASYAVQTAAFNLLIEFFSILMCRIFERTSRALPGRPLSRQILFFPRVIDGPLRRKNTTLWYRLDVLRDLLNSHETIADFFAQSCARRSKSYQINSSSTCEAPKVCSRCFKGLNETIDWTTLNADLKCHSSNGRSDTTKSRRVGVSQSAQGFRGPSGNTPGRGREERSTGVPRSESGPLEELLVMRKCNLVLFVVALLESRYPTTNSPTIKAGSHRTNDLRHNGEFEFCAIVLGSV